MTESEVVQPGIEEWTGTARREMQEHDEPFDGANKLSGTSCPHQNWQISEDAFSIGDRIALDAVCLLVMI